MAEAEDQIRRSAQEARDKAVAALNEGQQQSRVLTQQAQADVKKAQQEALNRLLADARSRGFTGPASALQAEMVGGADRRVQSMGQGLSARDRDYEARKAALGELYGRVEALAPGLAAQALAGRSGGGRGGGGRGGGGGGGGGDWSVQDDIFDELMDRIQQTDEDRTTMEYERLFSNLSRLPSGLQEAGLELWRQSGGDIPYMMQVLANPEDKRALGRLLLNGAPTRRAGTSWARVMTKNVRSLPSRRRALQAALDDALRHQRRIQTTTQGRRQQTSRDKTNSRTRSKTSAPHRGSLK